MLKRLIKPLIWTALALVLIIAAMAGLVALMEHHSSQRPDVALKTLSGDTVTLDQVADGKPMVVNMWATWCPPCIREMPLLEQAQKANPDVTFVFINQGEHARTAERFLENSGLSLENILLDSKGDLARVTASMALPTTLFYNADGKQTSLHRGELQAPQLNSLLERARN